MSDFLKPNRSKIIILFVILLLSIVVFVRSFMLGFAALGSAFEGFDSGFGILDYVLITFLVILFWPALIGWFIPVIGPIFNLLSIPFILIYWYLLSCLIFKVTSSARKQPLAEKLNSSLHSAPLHSQSLRSFVAKLRISLTLYSIGWLTRKFYIIALMCLIL